jgi:hypothetical protein
MPDSRIAPSFDATAHRRQVLAWLASLGTAEGAYRLWSQGIPHLLPTAFAVFVRELLDDLPVPHSVESLRIRDYLLSHRDPATGLFPPARRSDPGGRIHDSEYITLQQSHFALQALRILGYGQGTELPVLQRWSTRESLESTLESLAWRNPWLVSNTVMFLHDFHRHEEWLQQKPGPAPGWIRSWLERTQRPSGLWGLQAEKRVYNAIYGAFHFLYFWLGQGLAVPRADQLLRWTRGLQTTEGYFAHSRGGGACEDYDCADLLLKLGNERDRPALQRTVARILADRNPDGGHGWARKRLPGPRFLLGNWKTGLSLGENRRLLQQRLLDCAGVNRYWYYSGIRDLKCPTGASDIWSTWFRNLVLAEYDDTFGGLGGQWRFRDFPSMGWHPRKDTR